MKRGKLAKLTQKFIAAVAAPLGGTCLLYLVYGEVPFFRVSFSPIFSRAEYQSKDVMDVIIELVVEKAHFL